MTCAIALRERLSETAETASNVAITSKKILHVAHLALAAIDSPDRTHFEWEQSDRLRRGLLCLFTIIKAIYDIDWTSHIKGVQVRPVFRKDDLQVLYHCM